MTPGPWHIHKRYPFWVDDSEGRRIVDVEGSRLDVEEAKANARLIAASPELLEACKFAAEHMQEHDRLYSAEERELFDALRAAIAKAVE